MQWKVNILLICLMSTSQHKHSKKDKRHRKQTRDIRKCQPSPKASKKIRRSNSYILVKKKTARKSKMSIELASLSEEPDGWCHHLASWLQFDPTLLTRYISTICDQFAAFSSIDELFNLTSEEKIDNLDDFRHLQRYSRIVSLLNTSEGKISLLEKDKTKALITSTSLKADSSSFHHGMLLSENELVLIQKRSIFMERLVKNQSKYDSSLGRMSQISKELAFGYRSYLELRTQLQDKFKEISSNLADYFHPPHEFLDTKESYARILIGKNLRHTFSSSQLDRLNYFRMREYLQTDRLDEFQNITSFEQLQHFISKRKPKRNRKLALATACSVCLSDYYEMSNPLRSCSNCLLRAHELCYSFKQNRCGSCTYQKIERKVKEVLKWCCICKRSGLMTVKLGERQYAHGFCLLVHGFWGCNRLGSSSSLSESFLSQNQSYSPLENRCNKFYSPNQNLPLPSSTSINQLSRANQVVAERPNEARIHELEDFQRLGGNFESIEHDQSKWNNQVFEFGNLNQYQLNHQTCHNCNQPFLKDLFLTCLHCGHSYHALCAFLAGFSMEIPQGEFHGGPDCLPTLNCCIQTRDQISWIRCFKLNYNRCVFSLLPQDLSTTQTEDIWQE